jgi:large subunit ribosomal protein L10
MAIRAKKIQPTKTAAISLEKGRIQSVKDYIFTDYRGVTVEQISALRKQLREKNTTLHIVKNNFAAIAFNELKLNVVEGTLAGPTAVAYSGGDFNEVAKIIIDFAKEVPAIKVKGGLLENKFLDTKAVEAYAKLPSRSQLITMVMFAMNAMPSKLVRTLQAVADKKAAEGGAPAAEAAPAAQA